MQLYRYPTGAITQAISKHIIDNGRDSYKLAYRRLTWRSKNRIVDLQRGDDLQS